MPAVGGNQRLQPRRRGPAHQAPGSACACPVMTSRCSLRGLARTAARGRAAPLSGQHDFRRGMSAPGCPRRRPAGAWACPGRSWCAPRTMRACPAGSAARSPATGRARSSWSMLVRRSAGAARAGPSRHRPPARRRPVAVHAPVASRAAHRPRPVTQTQQPAKPRPWWAVREAPGTPSPGGKPGVDLESRFRPSSRRLPRGGKRRPGLSGQLPPEQIGHRFGGGVRGPPQARHPGARNSGYALLLSSPSSIEPCQDAAGRSADGGARSGNTRSQAGALLYRTRSRIYDQKCRRRRGPPLIAFVANGPCPVRTGGCVPHCSAVTSARPVSVLTACHAGTGARCGMPSGRTSEAPPSQPRWPTPAGLPYRRRIRGSAGRSAGRTCETIRSLILSAVRKLGAAGPCSNGTVPQAGRFAQGIHAAGVSTLRIAIAGAGSVPARGLPQ